jgi:hypothetical protein
MIRNNRPRGSVRSRRRRPAKPGVEHLETRLALSTVPVGYTPQQIRAAYGIDDISFGNIPGDGSGQTIAIVDAHHDPSLFADVATFDTAFGITQFGPTGPNLTIYNQEGQMAIKNGNPVTPGIYLPTVDLTGDSENEEALDVEWAHAIAPAANIDVIECGTSSDEVDDHGNQIVSFNDEIDGAKTAANLPGVSVVSMSFDAVNPNTGLPGEVPGERADYDPDLIYPQVKYGVTFVASTGDYGAPGGYSAYSPEVLAVGGTTLPPDENGNPDLKEEAGWGYQIAETNLNGQLLGSGGGISIYETDTFQAGDGFQTGDQRTIPDVAFDADPATGVAEYNSTYNINGPGSNWNGPPNGVPGNGTSLATPCWAGLIAIVDQGLALQGLGPLNGATQTLPAIYRLPTSDFNQILVGYNGYEAGYGYNLVTGRGSPIANTLVPDLVKMFLVQVNGMSVTPCADITYDGPVASFAINDPAGSPADYTATINWGDGTTTSGTIEADPKGGFEVIGCHDYSWVPAGTTYSITISLVNRDGYHVTGMSSAFILSSNLIQARDRTIDATTAQAYSGVLATFTDSDPSAPLEDYTAVIEWGPQSWTLGTIEIAPDGRFEVTGSEPYRKAGVHRATVVISRYGVEPVLKVVRPSGRRGLPFLEAFSQYGGQPIVPESAAFVPERIRVSVPSLSRPDAKRPLSKTVDSEYN